MRRSRLSTRRSSCNRRQRPVTRNSAIILIQRGETAAALEAAEQEPAGPWQDAALALARQAGPDRGAADTALKTLIRKDGQLAPYQTAEVYALRGDANATFQWLDRAWSNRDPGIGYLLYDPFILRFKDDPRFAAFCRKVGLPVPERRLRAPRRKRVLQRASAARDRNGS